MIAWPHEIYQKIAGRRQFIRLIAFDKDYSWIKARSI